MTTRQLFQLTGAEDVSVSRLNRVRARVTLDPTGRGEELVTVSTAVEESGIVSLPPLVSDSAVPVSAEIVDVRGGTIQDFDLSDVSDGLVSVEASPPLLDRLREPDPSPILTWARQGRFTIAGRPRASFNSFRLVACALSEEQTQRVSESIRGRADSGADWTRLLAVDGLETLEVELLSQQIAFDGSFAISLHPEPEAAGWFWALLGPVTFAGYRNDSPKLTKARDISILLPGIPVDEASADGEPLTDVDTTQPPPRDVTEREVVEHPEIFSDDPGPYCEPFSNPERILGERRFRTVLRVEQPEIAAAAGVRREAAAERIRVAAENALALDGELDVDAVAELITERRGSSMFNIGHPVSSMLDPAQPSKGRSVPGGENLIDWEGDTSDNQAVTVSGGHILDYRVRWRSNGYSLGTVNHTLTLAPRQIKRIMKIDFERREAARRSESLTLADEVAQTTEASRDYFNAVESNLSEWSKGRSMSKTSGFSAGLGRAASASAPVAPGVVVSGGSAFGLGGSRGRAETEGEFSGSRDVAASEEQRLRDGIRQYGEALRQLESTVITEIAQEESVEGVSEVIANPNYCHALTVVYYDILRHIRVDTELAGVSECLFVPFSITPFDGDVFLIAGRGRVAPGLQRILRYSTSLRSGLKDRSLSWVFRYLEDYVRNGNEDIPARSRKEQRIVDLAGEVDLEMYIASPLTGSEDSEASKPEGDNPLTPARVVDKTVELVEKAFKPFKKLFGGFKSPIPKLAKAKPDERETLYQTDFAPALARYLIDRLRLATPDGVELAADFTLDGRYRPNRVVKAHFRVPPGVLETEEITREDLRNLRLRIDGEDVSGSVLVPGSSFANVKSARISYRTDHYQHAKRSAPGVGDLLVSEMGSDDRITAEVDTSGADLSFPFDSYENTNMKDEIEAGVTRLVNHLNSHLHHYHKQIWWGMDRDELYTLLDGYTISARDHRSIASVVEREPLAILGNTLVFQVARGAFVGVDGHNNLAAARDAYTEKTRSADPMRVSLPTGGVYAQALKDRCNACEEHYGSTDWVLEREELTPQEIESGLLASRRAEPVGMAPTDLPETIINLQNAPTPPTPSGTEGILRAGTTSDAFRDLVGLEGTQASARAAMEIAAKLATDFGNMAAKQSDATRAAVERIQQSPTLTDEQKKTLIDRATSDSEAAARHGVLDRSSDLVAHAARDDLDVELEQESADGRARLRVRPGQPEGQDNVDTASGAASPLDPGAVAGQGGLPVGGGYPIAQDNPLDADVIQGHPHFKLPSENTLLEIFPGTDPVTDRIGSAERRRAVDRGFWWTATSLESVTPEAAAVGQIPLITYLVFDFPVGSDEIKADDLQPVRDLIVRRSRALNRHNLELEVSVYGTADGTGPDEINESLQKARAHRVADLIQSASFRIRYVGPSDSPIAPETNELGRALNRSVTIQEKAKRIGGGSVRRMPDEVRHVIIRAREKLLAQTAAGDVDADIGATLLDEYEQARGDMSVLLKGKVREYYNEYVPRMANQFDNPLYRADLFFTDGREAIQNSAEFATSPAVATDTELGSDDLILTVKELSAAMYEGINLHIQIGRAHDRGDSTIDPWDMMSQEINRRLARSNGIYAKCFDKYKDKLEESPSINF